MRELFLSVLNMSLTASYVILCVIIVRQLLNKVPKVIPYALWAVVAFRLIIPFSFESIISLIPRKIDTAAIPYNIIHQQTPQMSSGIEGVDSILVESLPEATLGASANPLQIYTTLGAYLWILGIFLLLIYGLISHILLRRKLSNAQFIEKNIFEAKNLRTPFVLGLVRPRIYLPLGLQEEERSYILLHEQTHIKRKDHIIKAFAFFLLSLHWFNPLVWIAFLLMNKDMELSCDERVLKEMGHEIKKSYANSLLALATERHILNGSPLAFGEGNVKGRILNVLNYKKPRLWVPVIAIIAVLAVGVALLANPIGKTELIKAGIQAQGSYSMVYLNPIFSITPDAFAADRQENEYLITEDKFEIVSNIADDRILISNPTYREETIGDKINVLNDFMSLDVSKYSDKKGFHVIAPDGKETGYIIYFMDDEIWVSHWKWDGINLDHWSCIYIIRIKSDRKADQDKVDVLIHDPPQGQSQEQPQEQPGFDVEKTLEMMMSSPLTSSNPQDHINAHKNEYESFFKYGGEDALQYMLKQFEIGNAEGLRGQLMMLLCKELLGARNNVRDNSLSPQEWYEALEIRQEHLLPDYEYDGQDPIERLVYHTEIKIESESDPRGGFIIVAPKIFGSYEEEDRLKVFVTTYLARYKLFGNTLSQEGGSIIPAAITYHKDEKGEYVLEKYEQARDGSEYGPSIREYCSLPVSGKKIKGLADQILRHDYDDLRTLLYENLYHHLKKNGITDATITDSEGNVIFSMTDPK